MEQLITINGKEYNVKISDSLIYNYTDVDGKEISVGYLGAWDPEVHKKLGFTTVRSVIKWFIKNREKLEGGNTYIYGCFRSYFSYVSTPVFTTGTYEDFSKELAGRLLDKSLEVTVLSNDSDFTLLGGDQGTPTYRVIDLYRNCIELEEIEHTEGTIWNKHYEYSFTMNSEEFNWFRSVSKENAVYFGLELEVSSKLSTVEIQKIVAEVEPKQEPFFIFKKDSTITGKYSNYLEIVTVPCTPRYLRKNFKIFFQKLEKLCANKNLQIKDVFDTSNNLGNGLHIHLSKDSFLNNSHRRKFLTAWHQWDEDSTGIIKDIAARPTDYTSMRWCSIERAYKETLKTGSSSIQNLPKFTRRREQRSLALRLKGIRFSEKYVTAHDNNSATIEVRVYQGIFDLKHIMQCISFTEAMFEYCQNVGFTGFDKGFAPQFTSFIKDVQKYKSLRGIFKYSKTEGEAA